MLAFALLPTISRATALAQGGTAWAEVCTPLGMQWVSADGERLGGPPGGASPSMDSCHFCQLAAAGAAPLPAAPPPLLLLPAGSEQLPRLFLQAAHTLHAWRRAQPRAPPVLS